MILYSLVSASSYQSLSAVISFGPENPCIPSLSVRMMVSASYDVVLTAHA